MVLMTISQNSQESKWQRRMGVEPTRDRAERPPSRFEDGETHRGLYTSIEKHLTNSCTACGRYCATSTLSCQVRARPIHRKAACARTDHFLLYLSWLA